MQAEVNVLGVLEVSIAGTSVVPSASKPRQLLAMLAINAGRLVTHDSLMNEIWGDDSPRSALGTLQTYVLHIRKLIRTAVADHAAGPREDLSMDILATRHTGYLLHVDRETIDAVRYDRLAASGRAAGTAGDWVRAEQLLGSALGLWRGPALVDVPTGPQLAIEAMRLTESRLSALTMRIDAELYLGRHHQLLGDLAALCARHPYMENFRAQYMLALYRSGRQGKALEVYQELWTTVREQLGVHPSARLRRLHQAVLAGAAMLDDPTFVVNSWTPAMAG